MSGNGSQVGAVARLTEPIGEHDTDAPPPQPAAVEPRLSIALRAADIVGVWDGDLVAGLVYGDSNFARIYGVDPATAARGVPRGGYFKNIHPDDLPEVQAEIARMFAGAAEYANEHRIIRPDGELRWVLTRGRLLRDTDGRPSRFAGISVDITERRRAEARQEFLLELADRLRTRPDGASIVDEAVSRLARHLGANRAGYARVLDDDATIAVETCYADGIGKLSGAFPLAHFGQSNVERHRQGLTIAHDDLAAGGAGDAAAFASGEIRAFVSVPLFRDGRFSATLFVSHREPRAWRPADVALIEHVAARLRDALERVHAEEALRQLNASLEAQVEERTRDRDRTWRLAPVVMVVADSRGILLEANPAWTRMLGWSRDETIGRDVMAFVAPEDRAAGAAGMARLFQGLPVVEYQLAFLTRNGERRNIVWTTVPDGDRLYGHGRDVTDQLLAEERLRQAQKMEAVGQLTGGLAHDFNNLLTGIAGALELLSTRVAQGRFAELDRYIGVARDATRRGAALTQRLLAFSRRQPLDPKVTDVNRLIAGMADLVQRTVGPALELELTAAPAPWMTLVDPHQLENALLNLCINARDAMPEGGRLSIATANRDLSEAEAREFELPAGQYLALSVTDTGAGMTPVSVRRWPRIPAFGASLAWTIVSSARGAGRRSC
jgi:PAS domain S-box-containing protein